MPQDKAVIDEIRARLETDPRIHNSAEVAVSERERRVTLRGTVRSLHQRRSAVEIARSVPGVLEVEDELQVDPRDHWDDDEIRGTALQALMSSDAVPDDRIDVTVTSGWLTLRGEVKHQQDSNAAFDAVSRIPGVGGITNEIKVIASPVDGSTGR
jgi:osmotically-inducible protein OsmY